MQEKLMHWDIARLTSQKASRRLSSWRWWTFLSSSMDDKWSCRRKLWKSAAEKSDQQLWAVLARRISPQQWWSFRTRQSVVDRKWIASRRRTPIRTRLYSQKNALKSNSMKQFLNHHRMNKSWRRDQITFEDCCTVS